jgi:GNAT superfamily N-acetyltransferase
MDLNEKHNQEWSDQCVRLGMPIELGGRSLIRRLVNECLPAASPPATPPVPWLWFLNASGRLAGPDAYCCGVVSVSNMKDRRHLLEPTNRFLDQEAECFIWVRGPYRNLGLGTAVMRELLQLIEDEAVLQAPRTLHTLKAYYPIIDGGEGAALERERWMNFFFDLGFRRVRQPDTGVASNFVVLRRDLMRG